MNQANSMTCQDMGNIYEDVKRWTNILKNLPGKTRKIDAAFLELSKSKASIEMFEDVKIEEVLEKSYSQKIEFQYQINILKRKIETLRNPKVPKIQKEDVYDPEHPSIEIQKTLTTSNPESKKKNLYLERSKMMRQNSGIFDNENQENEEYDPENPGIWENNENYDYSRNIKTTTSSESSGISKNCSRCRRALHQKYLLI
ncbi:hypothetical protein B9Z55_004273 [Caenorhabditis nigoni]|nr:hypothetical protein B9Z55_004273 [Caenorhabditis nigoni]